MCNCAISLANLEDTPPFDEPIIFDGTVLVGSHVPFRNGKISDSIRWGLKLGMYSIQIYMGSQQRYARSIITDADISATRVLLDRYPTRLFTHSPVIYNLAGSVAKGSLAWTGNAQVDAQMEGLLKNLNYELQILNQIGALGTVIHPGCCIPDKRQTQAQIEDDAISAIAKTLDMVEFKGPAKVLLENCAGERNKVSYNLEQLSKIRARSTNKEHIAFCLDSAHIWGAGLYDLSKIEGVTSMFKDIDKYAKEGKGAVELFHLNDSEVKFGSCVDRHACLGTGYIWKEDRAPLQYLLSQLGERNIPLVLETSPSDMYTLHKLLE